MAKKSKSKKSKFKGGVARNAAKQTRGTQFGHLNLPKGIAVFKEDPGSRVNIDILPYEVTCPKHPDRDDEYEIAVPGSLWYKRPYWLHRNIGADNQSIVCPSSIGEKCPICEYRAQLIKDGAEWNDDSVRALKASMRNLYMVVPKGNKKYDEEPHIWDISQYLFQDKLNEEIGENEEYETFPDLEEGLTLRIRFSEESFGSNKFAETSRIDFKKRNEPYDEAILEGLPSLDDLLEIPSYKAIDAMFFGGLSQEEVEVEVEEEEEEPEETSRSRRSRRRTVEPEEEPEEEEEEPEEEEEEPEEEEEEPEEEEEEPEEEEEEEKKPEPKKPTRKRNSKSEKAGKEDKKPSKGKKSKCPHGYKFGDDCEEYDECDECEMWEKCMDASEER